VSFPVLNTVPLLQLTLERSSEKAAGEDTIISRWEEDSGRAAEKAATFLKVMAARPQRQARETATATHPKVRPERTRATAAKEAQSVSMPREACE